MKYSPRPTPSTQKPTNRPPQIIRPTAATEIWQKVAFENYVV